MRAFFSKYVEPWILYVHFNQECLYNICSGQKYSDIEEWCELSNLQFVGETTFDEHKHQLVIPEIQKHCDLSLQQARQESLDRGKQINREGILTK